MTLGSPDPRFAFFAAHPVFTDLADARGQIEAATGIARVDPFLDAGLVRFVMRLPPEYLLHGHRVRGLFREACRGIVPDRVRLRFDKAHFEPAAREEVLAAGGFTAFQDLADASTLEGLGLVDRKRFRRAFDELATDPLMLRGEWVRLWPVLAMEAFARAWLAPRGASSAKEGSEEC